MQTRGIRNKNPFNIRHSKRNRWKGLSLTQTDKSFCQFTHFTYGISAGMKLLINYRKKYGLVTISQILHRFAPPIENETVEYIASVIRLSDGRFDCPSYKIDNLVDFLLLCHCMMIIESDYHSRLLDLYYVYENLPLPYRIYPNTGFFDDDEF